MADQPSLSVAKKTMTLPQSEPPVKKKSSRRSKSGSTSRWDCSTPPQESTQPSTPAQESIRPAAPTQEPAKAADAKQVSAKAPQNTAVDPQLNVSSQEPKKLLSQKLSQLLKPSSRGPDEALLRKRNVAIATKSDEQPAALQGSPTLENKGKQTTTRNPIPSAKGKQVVRPEAPPEVANQSDMDIDLDDNAPQYPGTGDEDEVEESDFDPMEHSFKRRKIAPDEISILSQDTMGPEPEFPTASPSLAAGDDLPADAQGGHAGPGYTLHPFHISKQQATTIPVNAVTKPLIETWLTGRLKDGCVAM